LAAVAVVVAEVVHEAALVEVLPEAAVLHEAVANLPSK
jgi:hypothetical protein